MTLPYPTDGVSYWLMASPAGPEHPPLSGDGAKDVVYCGTVAGGENGDRVVLVNGRDPLDEITNCPSPTTQRLTAPWDVLKPTLF